MNKIKSILCILLSLAVMLSICPFAFAADVGTTYYVDSINGDDNNNGTNENSAWKTVEKASSVEYSAGDKILFKAGGYFVGTFNAKCSGTQDNPITIGSYGDAATLGKPALTVNDKNAVIEIKDVSYWTVDGLDISAPNGKGVFIICTKNTMNGITVKNCSMHDIFKQRITGHQFYEHAPVGIASGGSGKLSDITIRDINITNCAYGIMTYGNNPEQEWSKEYYISPEESYTQNLLFENISMNNIYYDGMLIGSVNNLTVRNCAILNTALYPDFYTAPAWCRYSKNVLFENCEIAGSTNTMDGMAVDFDLMTTDSTYQYIFSHDNVRFMANCVTENETMNRNCTVRYCLSVNDNKTASVSQPMSSDATAGMENFKFYNNTIVDGGDFSFAFNKKSVVANNIFISHKKFGEIQTVRKYSSVGLHKFDGEFTNNCFVNYSIPTIAKNNAISIPGFVGGDYYDVNSYKLSASSPLIGEGIQVEEDMGEHDFYGNALTEIHNIGCFDAAGIDDGTTITHTAKVKATLLSVFYRLYGAILSVVNRF